MIALLKKILMWGIIAFFGIPFSMLFLTSIFTQNFIAAGTSAIVLALLFWYWKNRNHKKEKISAKETLSEENICILTKILSDLGFTNVDPEKCNLYQFNFYSFLFRLKSQGIKPIQTSYMLGKKSCFFECPSEVYEYRDILVGIEYSGWSSRANVGFGVSYRSGCYRLNRLTQRSLKKIDSGTLLITNQEILFVGNARGVDINLDKIIEVVLLEDAIGIKKESGPYRLFYINPSDPINSLCVHALLSGLVPIASEIKNMPRQEIAEINTQFSVEKAA